MQAVKTCTIIKKKWEVRKQPNFTIGVLLYLLLSGRAKINHIGGMKKNDAMKRNTFQPGQWDRLPFQISVV